MYPVTISITNLPTPPFIGTSQRRSDGRGHRVLSLMSPNGPWDTVYGASFTPTIAPNGTFSFSFSNPQNLVHGYFKIYAVASYTLYPGARLRREQPSTFKSDNTTPAPVTDFRLNPSYDTGIVGDNITSDPHAAVHRHGPSGRYRRVDRKPAAPSSITRRSPPPRQAMIPRATPTTSRSSCPMS